MMENMKTDAKTGSSRFTLTRMISLAVVGLMVIPGVVFAPNAEAGPTTFLDTFPREDDGMLTLFDQDYSQMNAVPDNIVTALLTQSPFIANITLSYNDTKSAVQVNANKSQVGQARVIGLTPALNSTYNLDFSWAISQSTWAGFSFYVFVAGVKLSIYSSSSGTADYLRGEYINSAKAVAFAFTWNLGGLAGNRYNITVISDAEQRTAWVSCGGNTAALQWFGVTSEPGYGAWLNDSHQYVFIPSNVIFSITVGGTTGDYTRIFLHRIEQLVSKTDEVVVIGSNLHQAIGFDGPHEPPTVIEGFELLKEAGATPTIFADVDCLANATWVAYLRDLIDNYSWELGIHYSEELAKMALEDAYDMMDSETATITGVFGRPPLAFCSFANRENWTHATYAMDNLNQIWRSYRMPNFVMGVCGMTNVTWSYYYDVAIAGYGTHPFYTHEVDIEPSMSAVDRSLFRLWLNASTGTDLKIVGYRDWYEIQANQGDAVVSNIIFGQASASFELTTNGYPAMVYTEGAWVFPTSQNQELHKEYGSRFLADSGEYATGLRAVPTNLSLNITMSQWGGSEVVAAWEVTDSQAVTYYLSDLMPQTGYRVYQDGQMIGVYYGPSISFTATGGGEFEIVEWYPRTVSIFVLFTYTILSIGMVLAIVVATVRPIVQGGYSNPEVMKRLVIRTVIFVVLATTLLAVVYQMFIGS